LAYLLFLTPLILLFLNICLLDLVSFYCSIEDKIPTANRFFNANVENTKFLFANLSMVLLKDLFSNLLSSSYTPLLLVLSYLSHLQIIISIRMILNFYYHSLLLTLHTIYYVYSWMSSNFFLIPLRLTFFLLVLLKTLSSVHSAPNSGVIFHSNLTFLHKFLLSLNHAIIIIVTSEAYKILLIILQPVGLLYNCHFSHSISA
jgi:hypothetical protein